MRDFAFEILTAGVLLQACHIFLLNKTRAAALAVFLCGMALVLFYAAILRDATLFFGQMLAGAAMLAAKKT